MKLTLNSMFSYTNIHVVKHPQSKKLFIILPLILTVILFLIGFSFQEKIFMMFFDTNFLEGVAKLLGNLSGFYFMALLAITFIPNELLDQEMLGNPIYMYYDHRDTIREEVLSRRKFLSMLF